MEKKSLRIILLSCLLGVLNGALFGGISILAQTVYINYVNWQLREASSSPGVLIHVTEGIKSDVLLFLAILSITFISIVAHRYLANRLRSVVRLWQCIGVIWFVLGLSATIIIDCLDRLYMGRPLDFMGLVSSSYILVYLITLAGVIAINSFYGAIIRSLLPRYSQAITHVYK